jgi:hypothetical protein|tara:strand:- start:281 stop:826 length:546 start_codon:yes stop_codon:yes gene_type:complete
LALLTLHGIGLVSGIGKVERELESPPVILDASFACVAQSVIRPRHLIHDGHRLQIAFRAPVMMTQAYAKRDILLATLLPAIALKSVHGASNELAWLLTKRGKLLAGAQKGHAAAQFKIGRSIKTGVYGIQKDIPLAYAWLTLAQRSSSGVAGWGLYEIRLICQNSRPPTLTAPGRHAVLLP